MLYNKVEWNKKQIKLPNHQNRQKRIVATVVTVICTNIVQHEERHVEAVGKSTTSKGMQDQQ